MLPPTSYEKLCCGFYVATAALIFPITSAVANSNTTTKAVRLKYNSCCLCPFPFTYSHCQQGTCHFCFKQENEANTALQLAEALTWPLLLESLSPSLLLPAVLTVPQVGTAMLLSSHFRQETEHREKCHLSKLLMREVHDRARTEALP